MKSSFKDINCPCIFRGQHKLFSPTSNIDTFKCYNQEIKEDKCIITNQNHKSAIYSSTAICDVCDRRDTGKQPSISMASDGEFLYIKTADLINDTIKMIPKIPHNISGIVGYARSGLIPASTIATLLHLPLYSFSSKYGIVPVGTGGRGLNGLYTANGPLLFVDDSIYSGNSMKIAKQLLIKHNMVFSAIYTHPDNGHHTDIFSRILSSPHLFEWNMFNNGMISGDCLDERMKGGIAFDFDGILCPDCPTPDADDGDGLNKYLDWMQNTTPYKSIPRFATIPLIITFRLEKWRSITENWLDKHGIKFNKLIMSQYETASERNRNFNPQEHKGVAFLNSDCSMFIESDPVQAELIHTISKKPVLCPDSGEIFQRYSTGISS